jgi:hypothetical protein
MDSPTKRPREPTETQDSSQDDTLRDPKTRKTHNDEQSLEEPQEAKEDEEEEDSYKLAYKILRSMAGSTWTQDFWTFGERFKENLKLSDEELSRFWCFKNVIRALKDPQKRDEKAVAILREMQNTVWARGLYHSREDLETDFGVFFTYEQLVEVLCGERTSE